MDNEKRIWTFFNYFALANALKKQFGPFNGQAPSGEAYKKLCDSFAAVVGASNGAAVKMQIDVYMLPVTTVGGTKFNTYSTQAHVRARHMALAAALEAGWLQTRDLPLAHYGNLEDAATVVLPPAVS
jgi:hypothetical protein